MPPAGIEVQASKSRLSRIASLTTPVKSVNTKANVQNSFGRDLVWPGFLQIGLALRSGANPR